MDLKFLRYRYYLVDSLQTRYTKHIITLCIVYIDTDRHISDTTMRITLYVYELECSTDALDKNT